jgi:hypothetical protein
MQYLLSRMAGMLATLLLLSCGARRVDDPKPRAPDRPVEQSAGRDASSGMGGSNARFMAGEPAVGGTDRSEPPRSQPSSGRRVSMGSTPLPCDVRKLLASACQGCHAAEPGLLAPMALVTREDLMAAAVSDPSVQVHQLMQRRVHDPQAPMPPSGSRGLAPDELAVIDRFVADGLPRGPEQCPGGASAIDGIRYGVPRPEEIGECYRFQAHDQPHAGDQTPYLAQGGEYYSCFYFGVPWAEGTQALTIRSLDTPLVHHWMLYHATEAYSDGQIIRQAADCGPMVREALGAFGLDQQREQHTPDGVGLQLPPPGPDHGLLLELHYFNPGQPVRDSAGVEVCTAKTPRPQTATISTLAATLFTLPPGQRSEIQTTCTPAFDREIYIFRAFPHMHARGTSMDVVIVRADGSRELMLDERYDFNHQITYDVPAVLRPGDRLITTCHYVNDTDLPIAWGLSTYDEMCNNFLYAWPAGALSNGKLGGVSLPCFL